MTQSNQQASTWNNPAPAGSQTLTDTTQQTDIRPTQTDIYRTIQQIETVADNLLHYALNRLCLFITSMLEYDAWTQGTQGLQIESSGLPVEFVDAILSYNRYS